MDIEISAMKYEKVFPATMDAEIQAIYIIPDLLKALPIERKIAILGYILGRYKFGDNFGIE